MTHAGSALRLSVGGMAFLMVHAACNSTYAPPIRGPHSFAPGSLTEGRIAVSGAFGGLGVAFAPMGGGPSVGVGIRDWFAIEAGSHLAQAHWALGYAGPRFTLNPHPRQPIHFAADLELGGGAGLGGMLDGNGTPCTAAGTKECNPGADGLQWSDRFAWGGYQGLGAGIHIHWLALYLRVRLEESTATHVPVTFWPSLMAGVDVDIARVVKLSLGGGAAGYTNRVESLPAWFLQFGVAVLFDAFGAARKPAQ